MHTLEAMHLSKTIKKTNIIREISIRVQSGEVVGLLLLYPLILSNYEAEVFHFSCRLHTPYRLSDV